jgi:hypothetical protein
MRRVAGLAPLPRTMRHPASGLAAVVVKGAPSGWGQQVTKNLVVLIALIIVLNVVLVLMNKLLPWLIGIVAVFVLLSLLRYRRWR